MKKGVFIICLFLSNTIIAQSQSTLKVYEGPEFADVAKDEKIQSIYTSSSGNTVVLRLHKKGILIDIFNSSLEKIFTKSIKIGKRESYTGNIYYNDEVKVFTETYKKIGEKVLSCYIINLTKKSVKKIQLALIKIDKKINLFRNKKGTAFAISPNQNYFSIASYIVHRDKIYFNVKVFNSKTYKLIYEKKNVQNENMFYEISDINVDNEGNVYVFGRSYYDKKSPKRATAEALHFILEKYSPSDYVNLKIDFENKFVYSLKTFVFKDSYNLYGLYSDKGLSKIKGVCSIFIDMKSMHILHKNSQDFPEQVYKDLFVKNKIKQMKKNELSNFYIDYVLKDGNNNVYLLAEEYYTTEQYFNGISTTVTHYDNIIIIKFNNKGDLDWGRSIYKQDNKPSYNAFLKNDELHVILNSGKNLKELDDGRTEINKGYFESSALYDFVYNSEGVKSIRKIQNNKGKTYYLPYLGNYIDGKFIMISRSRKRRKFMMLE